MKKRWLAILLALAMTLSLLPAAALAEGEVPESAEVIETAENAAVSQADEAGQPVLLTTQQLHVYWVDYETGTLSRGDLIDHGADGLQGHWGDNWGVLFYTDAGTSRVPTDAVFTFVPDSATNADAIQVTLNGDGSWDLGYRAIGSGVLQTTVNGVTYEIKITSNLPYMGWSTEATMSTDSYLMDRTFTYTDTNRTFYFVLDPNSGDQITGVSGCGKLDYTISAVHGNAGKLVTFTVPTGVDAEGSLNIAFTMANPHTNDNWTYYEYIQLASTTRRIVAQSDYRDYDKFFETVDNTYDVGTTLAIGFETGRVFYIRENGTFNLAAKYSVRSSNEAVMTVQKLGYASNTGNPIWNIRAKGFGTADVVLTFDTGEVMTYPVTVDVDGLGWATGTVLNPSTYVPYRPVYYTNDQYVFYAAFRDTGNYFDTFALSPDYAQYADALTVEFTPGSSYAKVTLDPTAVKLDGAYIEFLHTGSWNGRIGMSLESGEPKMVYRWAEGDRDHLTENLEDNPRSSSELNPGNSHWAVFCLRSGETVAPLKNITSVVSSNDTVAAVEYLGETDQHNPAYMIRGVGFGSAVITVTYDGGKTLTMPVNVTLPDWGFSSGTTLTQDNYLVDRIFHYTDSSRTFYYVVDRDNTTVSGVTLEGDLSNALNYTISNGGRMVTFTVKQGVTSDLWGNIFFELTDGRNSWNNGYSFDLENASPRMVYRWVSGDRNDLWEEMGDDTRSVAELNPGYTHWVTFCLRSAGAVTALQNITSVVSSNTAVAAVTYMGTTDQGNPAYEIHGVGFGSAVITVTYDGGKALTMPVNVVLPDWGWSSTTNLTQSTYISEEFTYTTTAPTLYYVMDGGTLTSFKLASDNTQYNSCFDITLAPDGSYAAVTVKPGAVLGGTWVNFEAEGTWNNGSRWNSGTSIRFINGNAPQLGTPSDLQWNVEYDWSGKKSIRMGSVGFKRAASDQAQYEIEYYRVGETVPVAKDTWGWGSMTTDQYFDIAAFIHDDLPSGEYYFRLRAKGDGYNYRSGDWVRSGTWVYNKPSEQLNVPTGLYWSDVNDELTMNWVSPAGAEYCMVEAYYAETQNGQKISVGSSWYNYGGFAGLWDNAIATFGDGWYFFRVRAISPDITKTRNSVWSDFSPGYCLGDLIASVNSALGSINTSTAKPEDIQAAVSVIDKLDEALAADTDNTGTTKMIEDLEKEMGVTTSINTANAPTGFAPGEVKITGAALNVDTAAGGTTATLEITAVDKNSPPPDLNEAQYENTIQFAMDISGAKDTDGDNANGLQLAVPVKITLPIPAEINPAFLVVLHYKSTGEWEELSWPHVYQENGKWYATFVVDSMSPFALAERIITASAVNGQVSLNAYLPTAGTDVNFLCAVYSADGQMLELITLQPHTSEAVTIDVNRVEEGMYLKVLSVDEGDGWIPVSGAQTVNITLENGNQ